MIDDKLVSIIIPVHNSSVFLEEAIESVLSQTYKNWELLIIDDHSTDNSLNIIDAYIKKEQRIKGFFNIAQTGVSVARNIGINNARGYYIAFLDSDDLWDNRKLEMQIAFLEKTNADFTFTAYRKLNEKREISRSFIPVRKKITYKILLKSNFIGCLTVLLKKEILCDLQFINEKHEDYILWLQLAKRGAKILGLNMPLAYRRIHKGSISYKKSEVFFWQFIIYREIERLPLLKCFYYFIFYIYNGIKKLIIK